MTDRVRALVVDDSAFARKVLRQVLSNDPRIDVVGFARDGLDALEKIAELSPDVVTLDLVMPELDGVGVLEALRERDARPEVVIVTMTDAESPLGIAALEAGAFDVVHKPTALATEKLYELGAELVEKVLLAADRRRRFATRRERHRLPPRELATSAVPSSKEKPTARVPIAGARTELLVIGASTGGPRAVTELLMGLPEFFPVPICVVLHMPAGYTEAFATRLDGITKFEVLEAREGMALVPGRVVIARAGSHLKVGRGAGGDLTVRLDVVPLDALHRPSVDVLFQTAAAALGSKVVAVVLTGMGVDGLEGARALHEAKARIAVEAASSCVVYGMPRAVWDAQLADVKVPIDEMVKSVLELL